jgi:hypothetical protein
MEATENHSEILFRAKVNMETAQIAWKELQRYFASGVALVVAADLDLVEVAYQMSRDNKMQIQQWMAVGKFGKVSDEQAKDWLGTDEVLWSVVVSPWVLVQPVRQLQ